LLLETGLIQGQEGEGGRILLDEKALEASHGLSQLSHCIAQGKVGSGFDVSAGLFGTHAYTRFTPELLVPYLTPDKGKEGKGGLSYTKLLGGSLLDAERSPLSLPDGMVMVLGGVTGGGTDTRDMVKKVNTWRKEAKSAPVLWESLAQASKDFSISLEALGNLARSNMLGYAAWAEEASNLQAAIKENAVERDAPPGMESIAAAVDRLTSVSESRRSLLQAITRESGADIEPLEQTSLLDDTMLIPGVVAAGVPGAGGYDAVFALALTPQAAGAVATMWRGWSRLEVPGMGVTVLESRDDGRGGVEVTREPRPSSSP